MIDPNIAIAIEELTEQMSHTGLCQSIQVLAIVIVLTGILFKR